LGTALICFSPDLYNPFNVVRLCEKWGAYGRQRTEEQMGFEPERKPEISKEELERETVTIAVQWTKT
jgi:hypothetical protein